MRRRVCLVAALLLASVLLLTFVFGYCALAASPKFIHVEGTYINTRPTTSNIVINGGFESALTGTQGIWRVITSDTNHAGTVAQSPDAQTGSYSGLLTVTANSVNGGFVALSQSTQYWGIGQSFTLSFYYKSTLSGCYASVYAKIQATTVGSDVAYWMSSSLPATDTWTPVTFTFGPIPDGTVDLQLHFGPPEGVTGSLWIDEVSTVAAANPTPSPTPATPSPTPSAAPTQAPTITPTPTSNPTTTPEPTPTTQPTTKPTNTQNPDPTTQPTASTDPQQPEVPELTIVALAAVLLTASALAIFSRKTRGTHFASLASASLAFALLFSFMPLAVYAETPPTASSPVTSFSLWYTNGTAFPTDGTNANGTEYVPTGAPAGINIGGIHCVPSGYGSSRDQVTNIVVLRNDGNVAVNVSLTLKNVVAPSNIKIIIAYYPMNNQTLQPMCSGWMGVGDVGKNPLAPGQYMWLAIDVILAQTSMPVTGTPNYNFNYSFDIEVSAIEA